ncbi:MAG: SDR family oxidoreductase, partial [Gammaproteobacteria bacterium]|nr:SDR family oxidoreductase [Gammaproteobacteria bacterium]
RLDILVNNAGTNKPQAFAAVDSEALDVVIGLNVRAAFLVAQAAVRVMLRTGAPGSVIHMSSQMGHVGSPNRSVYCMTKHAIEGLTKAMAVELAPVGIRVNSVAPTFIETPLVKPMLADPEFRDFVQQRIPLGRAGEIDDVVRAVLFLADPRNSMITGHSLRVDGGWTAQ